MVIFICGDTRFSSFLRVFAFKNHYGLFLILRGKIGVKKWAFKFDENIRNCKSWKRCWGSWMEQSEGGWEESRPNPSVLILFNLWSNFVFSVQGCSHSPPEDSIPGCPRFARACDLSVLRMLCAVRHVSPRGVNSALSLCRHVCPIHSAGNASSHQAHDEDTIYP